MRAVLPRNTGGHSTTSWQFLSINDDGDGDDDDDDDEVLVWTSQPPPTATRTISRLPATADYTQAAPRSSRRGIQSKHVAHATEFIRYPQLTPRYVAVSGDALN